MGESPPIFPGVTLPQGTRLNPHRGGAVLALGIVGLALGCIIGWVPGIIAWVMANNDLQEMDAGVMDPAGRSLTNAGRICGIISVTLAAIGLVVGAVFLLLKLVTSA